jgi:16S rRNA C1402 (ribose-2'-O) methylase RsmI
VIASAARDLTDSFLKGFLPHKSKKRRDLLSIIGRGVKLLIVDESPTASLKLCRIS